VVPIGSPCEQRRTCWGSERLHFAPGPQPFLTGRAIRLPHRSRVPSGQPRSHLRHRRAGRPRRTTGSAPRRTAAGERLTALGHRLAHEGSRRAGSPPAVLAAAAWPGRARSGAGRRAAALRDKLKRRREVGSSMIELLRFGPLPGAAGRVFDPSLIDPDLRNARKPTGGALLPQKNWFEGRAARWRPSGYTDREPQCHWAVGFRS
jgi:hypothetical protein